MMGKEIRVSTALQDFFLGGKVGVGIEDKPVQSPSNHHLILAFLDRLVKIVNDVYKLLVLHIGKSDAHATPIIPGEKVLMQRFHGSFQASDWRLPHSPSFFFIGRKTESFRPTPRPDKS
jgi:hypothetical protein